MSREFNLKGNIFQDYKMIVIHLLFLLSHIFNVDLLTPIPDQLGVCKMEQVEREEIREDLTPILEIKPFFNCSSSNIDAAVMTSDWKTYLFKGAYYWRLVNKDVAPGYPRLISQDWDGLPSDLDAALTWRDGRTFFFKGKLYWSFHNKNMDRGYPRLISEGFCGIPNDLDAAVMWKPFNKAYLFKGENYWRFDGGEACSPVRKEYPLSITKEWEGIPGNVDAALQKGDGETYFFKGLNYYRYHDEGPNHHAGQAFPIYKKFGMNCTDLKCRVPFSRKELQNTIQGNLVIDGRGNEV